MPIIRARYPDDWKTIAQQVKQAANWCCEQCQRPCRKPSESLRDFLKRVQTWQRRARPNLQILSKRPDVIS